MIYDEFSPSRTRRTLTAGGRTAQVLTLPGDGTAVTGFGHGARTLLIRSAYSFRRASGRR